MTGTKSKDPRKLMAAAISICFLFAAERLYRFQYEHVPLANEGDCIEIVGKNGYTFQFTILQNDSELGVSVTMQNDGSDPAVFSYSELKDLNAKKVDCSDKNDY